MRQSTRNFNTHPGPDKAWAFEVLKIGLFKFLPPRAKKSVQMPSPIFQFVCQGPSSVHIVFGEACV